MQILFPVGRLIGGSVHKLKTVMQQDGKTPKLKAGSTEPQQNISFGVAIAKTQARWQDEPWGQTVFQIGSTAFPQMHVSPAFAWKIVDGDSTIPNKRGKVPKDMTGHAGHWVIWFSQGWAPKLVTADGAAELPGDKFVPGYYVQVLAEVSGNGATGTNTPGVYMNPVAVALAGIGEVIAVEVDTTSVGFGSGTLPAGAQAAPAVEAAFGASAPPAATPVVPNTAFMAPPAPAAAPAAPRVPVKTMTAKANGVTYEQFKADPNWTDELMVAQGYLVIS